MTSARFLLLSLVPLFCPLLAWAQMTELSGRVTDPSDAVISGATVSLLRVESGTIQTTESNEAGYYFFPSIQPGSFDIEVEKSGFQAVKRSGVIIATADRARVDFTLEVGAVTEALTVVAGAPLIQTGSAEIGTTVTSREYDRLPQIQYARLRTPANFLYLSPGVQGIVTNTGQTLTQASNSVRINGSPNFYNEYYLDGLATRFNFNESAPPIDAIQEFKLQANQISAEFGRTGSAVTSFTIKSGTNELHGTAFDILRNEKLDARSFFDTSKAPFRQNEFGATVGGPILIPKLYDGKNRSFFFFSFTGSRKRGLDKTVRLRIPTSEELAGDFSNTVNTAGQQVVIYDPATTRLEDGVFVRDPFPGNRIPQERLDPVAASVAALYPDPNLTGAGVLNFQAFSGDQLLDPVAYIYRIDHTFSNGHKLSFTDNRTNIPRLNLTVPLPGPLGDMLDQVLTTRMVRGNYDAVLRSNLLNTLSVGANFFKHKNSAFYANQGYAAQFGLTGIAGDAFPFFSFTDGYASLGRTSWRDDRERYLILKNTLSWSRGRQILKFGAEYRGILHDLYSEAGSAGSYSFNSLGTALPSAPSGTGNALASFLLGEVHSGSLPYPFRERPRDAYWGFFVQDDVRLTPALTINLGLRYEFSAAPWEADDQYSLVDVEVPNPAAGGLPGAALFAGSGPGRVGSSTLVQTDYSAIGPRIGFAWQFLPSTVLRGGYGIYYGTTDLSPVTDGFRSTLNLTSLDSGVTPAFRLRDGWPQISPEIDISPSALNRLNVTSRGDTIGVMPRTQNWSLSVQHALANDLALELNYVANKNTRQIAPGMVRLNQLDPQYLALGALLTQDIDSAAARAAGIPIPYRGFTGSVSQALRPYPQYLNVTEQEAKAGESVYHGLTVRLRKRYSQGLTVDGHYTWSKSTGTTGSLQDNYNRSAQWGLLEGDIPHALVIQSSYELPFGPGKRMLDQGGIAGTLTGGWQLGAILRYQSGTPLPITMSNTLPLFNAAQRPDVVAGETRATGISNADFEPGRDSVISRSAFAVPNPFTFGNAAPTYGDLRNFPVLNEDFILLKNTQISQRFSLETNVQVINAFNRHRFATINTNFSNAAFGQPTATSLGRIITIGMKLRF
ncbi:MAG: hypothetical protein GEU99_25370 [Luteitalea sp.]|nr:hypothetical protein [Luteitalea sp.]